MNNFAIIPIEAFQDKRLTLEQLRVLGALMSFRNPKGDDPDLVWPSRQAIAERCGIHVANISTATSALVRLGWLSKDGKGGYSKATRYTISLPSTLAHSATVAESATVAHSATSTVAEQATRPLAESATRKEVTNEVTKEREQATIIPLPADKKKKTERTFKQFSDDCKASGEKIMENYEALFDYLKKIDLPEHFASLAWMAFKDRYMTNDDYIGKRYLNWRQVFLNAVKCNWFGFWKRNRNGEWYLTDKGQQADLEYTAEPYRRPDMNVA